MTKELNLVNGEKAIINGIDYDFVNKWEWRALFIRDRWYVVRYSGKKVILLHRVLMNVKNPSNKVDHIDNNGLNNDRLNLRVCTSAQNSRKRKAWKTGTSKYLGVHKVKDKQRWWAVITINYKNINLGYYDDEIEAAKAYDKKAIDLFGDYANPNFK